jgi:hypothetical protein
VIKVTSMHRVAEEESNVHSKKRTSRGRLSSYVIYASVLRGYFVIDSSNRDMSREG